ncbi:MAG: hypothetical protein EA379_00105 [Phycisphaerales bacterium]|nr:MAG: hypothetical protein EA379_00105 [Phycisphaerales bacterium]
MNTETIERHDAAPTGDHQGIHPTRTDAHRDGPGSGASGGGVAAPARSRVLRAGSRVLVALLAAGLFVMFARGIDPADSSAVSTGVLSEHAPATVADFVNAGLLGQIESSGYTVRILATNDDEPVYTVLDANGVILGERLRADEVYHVAPGLDINRMLMAEPLMLADFHNYD